MYRYMETIYLSCIAIHSKVFSRDILTVYTKATDLQENGNDIHNVLMTTRGS